MIKVDLITGFLGSGKTTFIREYARFLMAQGMKIAILENDYGAVNVDRMLLSDLEGPLCDLEMVVGGEDYETHKRRFRSKLIALGMLGYNRILVEPSGIYDVDEFLDVLHEEPLDRWYEAGTVLSIVDAALDENLSEESEYLLLSQIADAGLILLSKANEATKEQIGQTIAHLNRSARAFRCDRIFDQHTVLIKDWPHMTDQDFHIVMNAGMVLSDHIKLPVMNSNNFESLFFMNVQLPAGHPEDILKKMLEDPGCGNIIRIKGYLKEEDGSFLEINAAKNEDISVKKTAEGQEVLVVIGEHLKKDRVGSYLIYKWGSGRELLS